MLSAADVIEANILFFFILTSMCYFIWYLETGYKQQTQHLVENIEFQCS